MKLRRLSAHYIFSRNCGFLKFGILEVHENGSICSLTDTFGKLEETSRLEFYNGILVPGFMVAGIENGLLAMPELGITEAEINKISVRIRTLFKADQPVLNSNEDLHEILNILYLIQELKPELGLEKLLAIFTSKSSEIHGISDFYGTFEAGKTPGVYLLTGVNLPALRLTEETSAKRII